MNITPSCTKIRLFAHSLLGKAVKEIRLSFSHSKERKYYRT